VMDLATYIEHWRKHNAAELAEQRRENEGLRAVKRAALLLGGTQNITSGPTKHRGRPRGVTLEVMNGHDMTFEEIKSLRPTITRRALYNSLAMHIERGEVKQVGKSLYRKVCHS